MPNNIDIVVTGKSTEAQAAFQGVSDKLKDMKPNLEALGGVLTQLGGGFLGLAGNAVSSAKDQHCKAILYLITL